MPDSPMVRTPGFHCQGPGFSPSLGNLDCQKKTSEKGRRRQWHPTPVLLPGKSHGWKSMVGYSPDQIRSVTQSCPTLCDPMNRSTPGLPVHHQLPEFTQTHFHRVSDAISHLILCRPLLLLPPIPPSIRVFSNESTLRMRWPKY